MTSPRIFRTTAVDPISLTNTAPRIKLLLILAAGINCKLLLFALLSWRHSGVEQWVCGWDDCSYYLHIAREGYSKSYDPLLLQLWAYFPLFPLLVRALASRGGLGWSTVTLVTSNLCYVAFLIVGARYVEATRDQQGGRTWLIVGLCFPYSFYFSVGYSESLFGLLVISAAHALRRGRHYRASGLIALLGATRPTGILFFPVILLDRGLDICRKQPGRLDIGSIGKGLLAVAIAPIGLTTYMAFQYWAIGDGLAFSHVLTLWGRHFQNPFADIWRGLQDDDWQYAFNWFIAQSGSYNACWALVGIVASLYLCYARRFCEAWICGGVVLLAAATGLTSMPRYVATNPFFLIGVTDLVSRLRTWWLVATVGMFVSLQTIFLIAWGMKAQGLW
jgi:hypothetical protein